jgi:hypothetical protein
MIEIPKILFDEKGDLVIAASLTSSKEDFDFYVGKWKVNNKKLKTRFNQCTEWLDFVTYTTMYKTLNGYGNIDHNYTSIEGVPFEGMSIRFFNPASKLWSIHWADTNTLAIDKPTVGSFDNDFGHFFAQYPVDGKDVVIIYRWDIRDRSKPIWSQAFSDDKGLSWEWNWYMYFEKVEE